MTTDPASPSVDQPILTAADFARIKERVERAWRLGPLDSQDLLAEVARLQAQVAELTVQCEQSAALAKHWRDVIENHMWSDADKIAADVIQRLTGADGAAPGETREGETT